MRSQVGIWALMLALASGQALAEDRGVCEPPAPHFFQRLRPVGGWHPDRGGLVHWWNRDCFPRCGGLDDYCRKPLPRMCWPPYPPYYISRPPEIHHSRSAGASDTKTMP
jgi:hypothetical protein